MVKPPFEPGQRVQCVESAGSPFKHGEIYEVLRCYYHQGHALWYVLFMDDEAGRGGWTPSRFIPLECPW
jgi:hypothetical protein